MAAMTREQLQQLYENANWCLQAEMPDGSQWTVPVMHIANSRAAYYAPRDFGGDQQRALFEDTLPLFHEDATEIIKWAASNMKWADVCEYAKLTSPPLKSDYQDGWTNGDKKVVTC